MAHQPQNLVATPVSTTEIELSWDDVGTLEDETFDIERNSVIIEASWAGGTTYADTGLDPDTTYTYRVRAVGGVVPEPVTPPAAAVAARVSIFTPVITVSVSSSITPSTVSAVAVVFTPSVVTTTSTVTPTTVVGTVSVEIPTITGESYSDSYGLDYGGTGAIDADVTPTTVVTASTVLTPVITVPFSPLGLGASLHVWYDTTQLAFTNGQNVTAWTDAGPGANNLTTVAGTKTYTDSVQNGLPGVLFPGTNGVYLLKDTFTQGDAAQPYWIFLALKIVAVGGADKYFFDDRSGGNAFLGHKATTGNLNLDAGTGAGGTDTGDALGLTARVVTFKASGASSEAWIDGVSVWTGNPGGNSFAGGFIMGQLTSGASGANFYWLEGFLATGDQSGQRSDIESYFGDKWGITVT